MLPESVDYDADADKVTLRFASSIPEGTYRLDIGQSGGDNRLVDGFDPPAFALVEQRPGQVCVRSVGHASTVSRFRRVVNPVGCRQRIPSGYRGA